MNLFGNIRNKNQKIWQQKKSLTYLLEETVEIYDFFMVKALLASNTKYSLNTQMKC